MEVLVSKRSWAVGLAAVMLVCVGCKKKSDDDDGDTTTSTTGSYWYVGKDGTMFRMDEEGDDPMTYALETGVDLLAIACRGAEEAWVVGEDGMILFTFDGGETWDEVVGQAHSRLTAVAVDGDSGVWIAGENGTLLRTPDQGKTWLTPEHYEQSWTGISVDATGTKAMLSAAEGAVWRHDGDEATRVFEGGEVLSDVWLTPDATVAAAVGSAGTLIETSDGGDTWSQVPIDTTRDLNAVYVTGDGASMFAVGEAGVVVRLGAHGNSVEELLSPELSLRDLHLSAHHAGHVIGDAGTALMTFDVGETWEAIELDTENDFTALDQLHAEPHL
jgi:photosystem II stability/assembly factor-like uncharacterized protein